MTHRERVLAAMAHKQPDRVPCEICFRKDVKRKLIPYLGLKNEEELYDLFGADVKIACCDFDDKEFNSKVNGTIKENVEEAGGKYILKDGGIFEDIWGVQRRVQPNGLYVEWVSGPLEDAEDVDDILSYNWPDINSLESQEVINERVRKIKEHDDYFIRADISNPYKQAWAMRGMENFLCDTLADPDMALALMWKCEEYFKEAGLRLIRAGADMVSIIGDIATQKTLLFSQDVYRQIMKPVLQDMIKAFKAENPNIIMFFHSDGCLDMIVDELIDTGFDVINPIQPECMDIFAFKEKYGDKVVMHGTVSIQELLPHGTVEDVKREVRKIIDICGKNGGLVIAPSNLVQNDTPLENIVAMYEEINQKALR